MSRAASTSPVTRTVASTRARTTRRRDDQHSPSEAARAQPLRQRGACRGCLSFEEEEVAGLGEDRDGDVVAAAVVEGLLTDAVLLYCRVVIAVHDQDRDGDLR